MSRYGRDERAAEIGCGIAELLECGTLIAMAACEFALGDDRPREESATPTRSSAARRSERAHQSWYAAQNS